MIGSSFLAAGVAAICAAVMALGAWGATPEPGKAADNDNTAGLRFAGCLLLALAFAFASGVFATIASILQRTASL